MIGIIMEGALFVALIATVAALLFYALFRWTPLGLRLRQDRNRREIEHTLDLECPIHGLQREEETVRMPSGFQAQGDSIQAAGRAKAILAEAEAQSKANRLLSGSITPTLVQYEMSKRWNGQMPQVSGSAMPMIQLPAPGK